MVDVIIIGGGLAGIAAACEIQAQGYSVQLLERNTALGGKAGTLNTKLGDFPTGPSSFNGRHAPFWRLLRLLKLDDCAVQLSPKTAARYIVRRGQLKAIHPNLFSVLTTGALSLSDKLALARDFLSTKRAVSQADESLHNFLERRFGRALVDNFFAAVLTGIFAGDLKLLSAQSCMPALLNAEREYGSVLRGALKAMRTTAHDTRPGIYTFKNSFAAIGEAASKTLPVHTGVTATQLQIHSGEVQVIAQNAQGKRSFRTQHVILATEAFAAASLLQQLVPEAAKVLATFRYVPLTLVHWAERHPGESKFPEGFGYLAAPVENCFALGSIFVSDFMARAPRRLFSTFIGGGLKASDAILEDSQLAFNCARDVEALTGGKFGEIAGIIRWPQAVFQPPVGHAHQLQKALQSLEDLPVSLAGSYLGGGAMKDALASGFAAAQALRIPNTARRKVHS